MQAQNTTAPPPTRQDLEAAWAAYEAARDAAVASGLEYRHLSMAAADAYTAYDRLNRRIVGKLPIDKPPGEE